MSVLGLGRINELKIKYNQSFLIATHDDSIRCIADRILYLENGELKEGI